MAADGAGVVSSAPPRELDLAAIAEEGARLWKALAPGSVVWLTGDLGAGKTTLVQAINAAAGAQRARSPTFALVHEYASPHGTLVHADCYRLRHPDEAQDLDLAGLAKRARLLLIEWPERAGAWAPAPDVHLKLRQGSGPELRLVEVTR